VDNNGGEVPVFRCGGTRTLNESRNGSAGCRDNLSFQRQNMRNTILKLQLVASDEVVGPAEIEIAPGGGRIPT
jgi:hypothetical protein